MYKEEQEVVIHSLGPEHGDAEYAAVIRGIYAKMGDATGYTFYIVELVDTIDPNYAYSCAVFSDACIKLRAPSKKQVAFEAKWGAYTEEERTIGKGIMVVETIPCEAPWCGYLGAGMIMITGIRRKDGKVEFQLGDKKKKAYLDENSKEKDKTIWVMADDFFDEWPQ
jgi:hypothetical protein